MRLLLPAFFGASLVPEVHSVLRGKHGLRLHAPEEVPEDPALKEIGEEYQDAADAVENKAKKAFRRVQRGPGSYGDAKKPMMDTVEVARMNMCYNRNKLLEHEECMTWMVQTCKEETTGEGTCRKLRRYVAKKCKDGNEKGCSYADDLGIKLKSEDEEEQDAGEEDDDEEKDAEEQVDADDQDADGVKDGDDAFPDNPLEQKDSDDDGIGDGTDRYPDDPTRAHAGEPPAAPSPAAAGAPGPSPGPMPTGLSMDAKAKLPSQGYNEHSIDYVAHADQETMTKDWRNEWPMSEGSEEESIHDICAKQPKHPWCRLKRSKNARKAYAVSHP